MPTYDEVRWEIHQSACLERHQADGRYARTLSLFPARVSVSNEARRQAGRTLPLLLLSLRGIMVSSCTCPTCGKVFNKARAVEKHLQQGTHAAYKCPACVHHFLDANGVATVRDSLYRNLSVDEQEVVNV